jgi:thiol:disulfide interchange protein DsbD
MILSEKPLDYLNAFLGGVGISFTPCVLPLVPVIIGYIGITPQTSRARGLMLSLIYVSGVAITYAVLGLIASLTGKLFGTVSAHPVTNIIVGLIFILFGISMLDVFSISLPHVVPLVLGKEKNYFSIFLLGLSSGLVVGPCTAPALGAILFYLAQKKNILYGASVLLSFGFGMGLILILAGTFGSLMVNIRKIAQWSPHIKRLGAVILMGMGVYFIYIAYRRM